MTGIYLAHSSHWLINLLYMAPVAAFLAWLGLTTFRERRERARESKSEALNHRERRRER